MVMVKKFMWSLAGVVVAGLVVPPGSWGQATKEKRAAATGPVEVEEITVTAQKREENIQEIPVSVTAVTGAALEQQGIPSLMELGQSVPNMSAMSTSSGEATVQVSMRGTFAGETSLSQAPTVGFHLDGFYLAKNLGNNMDLEDLERVEVLRGPQGTLFGRNTTGGALNLVTKKPTEERSITASTQVGNFDAVKERLTVNVPLIGKNGFFQSDALGTLSLRENAAYRSHEPYIDNRSPVPSVPASGTAGMSNTNRVFNMTELRWQPIKEVTVDYGFEYHRYRDSIAASQVVYVYPGSLADSQYKIPGTNILIPNPVTPDHQGLVPYVRPNFVSSFGTTAVLSNNLKLNRPSDDGNNRIHMLTAAWDLGDLGPLGSVTLKSISGYRNMSVNNNNALSGSPVHFLDFVDRGNLETWSQELQVIGHAPRLNYVLGAYYYGEHTTDVDEQTVFGGLSESHGTTFGTVQALAPFGQVTVTPPILNDKLSITAGLRFSYEHISVTRDYLSGSFATGLSPVAGFPLRVAGTFGVHGTALPGLQPMANIAYQWTDATMTYLKVARGFQSGTVNSRATNTTDFSKLIEPENLLSYEGGVKSQWFDNRLRLNVDGFVSEYTNQLVQTINQNPDPKNPGFTTLDANVGSSEFWGFELEAVALPLRGVEASLNYSYLNTKFLRWVEATGQIVNGQAVMANRAAHHDVAEAPDNTITAGLTYTAPPTTAGVFSAHVDGSWVDSTVNNVNRPIVNGVEHAPISMQGNYAVFNARMQFVDIPLQKGSLDISAFCHNLADRRYRTFGIDIGSQLGFMTSNFADPRTFGLQLTYNFNES